MIVLAHDTAPLDCLLDSVGRRGKRKEKERTGEKRRQGARGEKSEGGMEREMGGHTSHQLTWGVHYLVGSQREV